MNGVEELAQGQLTSELYETLRRMCRLLVRQRRYPESYSPTSRWDEEGFDDIVDHWITRRWRLLTTWAHQPQWFWFQAERSLERFILNQRQRTVGTVLHRQIKIVLRRDPRFREKARGIWGLSEWTGSEPDYNGFEPLLLRATASVGQGRPVTKMGKLRSEWVADAIDGVLKAMGTWVREGELTAALLHILSVTQGVLVVDASTEPAGVSEQMHAVDGNVEEEAMVSLAAYEVLADLSEKEQRLIFALSSGTRLIAADVAKAMNVSAPTAKRLLEGLVATVERHSPDGVSDRVISKILEISSMLTEESVRGKINHP